MKVRLEIIDDDGTESANVEFAGRHWKKRLMAFLDTVIDETETITEPSSISSNFKVQAVGQNTYQPQPQYIQQQHAPVNIPQQMQQTVPQQQFMPLQQQQIQMQYQPVQQAPAYMPQQQNNYPNYNLPQYVQSNLPPVGLPQYGFEQPARATASTVHPLVNTNSHVPPAASYPEKPARRRTTALQERLNDASLTINERLELFLRYEYPRVWFSSQDVQKHYEKIYGEIKQSTVSTYLSRMFRKNLLERRGNRTQREYRYIGDEQESPSFTGEMAEMQNVPVNHRFFY